MVTKSYVRGGRDADGTRLREPSVSVRLRDGTVSERPLRQLTAGEVVAAVPWRSARSARGQAHYPGYYWSATAGGHLIYRSHAPIPVRYTSVDPATQRPTALQGDTSRDKAERPA
jgi:hypothetical protein